MSHAKWCISEWHPTRDDCTCGAALDTLAHNLAVAAFGCAAFEQGALAYNWTLFGQDAWHPGCGRDAPGWRDR